MAAKNGPWVAVDSGLGRTLWKMEASEPNGPWHLEYRREEPGCPAGWWLFGDGVGDGVRLCGTSEDVRYKAFLRVVQILDKRGKSEGAILWGSERGEDTP